MDTLVELLMVGSVREKKDIRSKIANIVSNTARNLNAVIVLENLPEQCPRNMIRDVRDPALRHRIYQAGFRGMVKATEEKCLEREGSPWLR